MTIKYPFSKNCKDHSAEKRTGPCPDAAMCGTLIEKKKDVRVGENDGIEESGSTLFFEVWTCDCAGSGEIASIPRFEIHGGAGRCHYHISIESQCEEYCSRLHCGGVWLRRSCRRAHVLDLH